jgi:xylulokinase
MMEEQFDSVNIVIDIGSSSIRVVAFSLTGKTVAAIRHDYETFYPSPGWAEQNPHDWENATLRSLSELMQSLPGNFHINGLSCTGQCPSYVPVDSEFRPLGNVLTYQDNRSTREAEYIASLVGNEYVHSHSGHSIEPFFILPKLLWHKNQNPELYKKIYKVLQPADYLEYFLTGNLFTDYSYACGTLVYDMNTRSWNDELLQKLGIAPNLFPDKIIHSWDEVASAVLWGSRRLKLMCSATCPALPLVSTALYCSLFRICAWAIMFTSSLTAGAQKLGLTLLEYP